MTQFNVPQRIFPMDALPPPLAAAVLNVYQEVCVPIDMAVSSMLGALSLAGQELADVRRPNGLEGPVGLYLLTIAESGDRKTTCDRLFTKAIQIKERELAEKAAAEMSVYEAKHRAWCLVKQAYEKELQKEAKKVVKNA